MTLKQFLSATHGMPGSTPVLILSPWGELDPAKLVTIEDLAPGDPLRDEIPPQALVLAGEPAEPADPTAD